nr:hypothetical protein [Tanacetum cinerariifolium]
MMKKPSIPRRNKVNWHYVRDDILFSTIKVAYKEYYACATGEAAPKPKASARRKRGGSTSSTTPPTPIATPRPITTVVAAPRLTADAKGKQPTRATSPTEPLDVERTEAEQLKIILRRSKQETHISQQGGSSIDEGTGSQPGVSDIPSDDSEEEISWNSFDDEDVDGQTKGRDNNEGEKTDESDANDDDQDEAEKDNDDDDDDEEISKIDEQEATESGEGDDEETKSDRESEEEETRYGVYFYECFIFRSSSTFTHIYNNSIHHDNNHNSKPTTNSSNTNSKTIDDNMKKIIKEQVKSQVKAQVTRILPRIEESVNAQLEAEVLTRLSHSSRTSYAVAIDLSKMELKKILIDKMEGNKSIQRLDEQRTLYKALVEAYEADKTILDSYGESAILKRRREDDDDQEGPSARSDRGSKRRREEEPVQTTCQMKEPSHPVFETGAEDQPIVQTSQHLEWFSLPRKPPTPDYTPIDFSNFIMNRLGVDTLTPKLLAGPTYELMRGSCNSLTELEYHLEEVYKATTDQLDWVNPEGQQYPHNLLQPLPLIPDNRGRRVIPFEHFINNDLEYLRGGASSRKYTTSVTKTKATDYGHIKWIEALVPRTMWIQEPLNYDKHALWGVSHWGRKQGDFKRLRLQDIEDMLLLLVQRKLSNMTVKERFAFNVSLRMFTRSIVIQRRVEDLELGVESYQKRLNLTKIDTYRSNLKQREAYTAYSYPKGFIYQNKDKKNRLMRIDELHKFSDETLNDVRNALDDRLKGIRMQYLPTTIWRKGAKDRATAMIQAINKMLKTRRIMRSLERFVGGRQYEGDF